MPIIDANESVYQDDVKILNHYGKWTVEIFQKAGLLKDTPEVAENPAIAEGAEARPGQPGAHSLHINENMDLKVGKVSLCVLIAKVQN